MSNPKILVTGGAGYVGSVLVPYILRRRNWDVLAVDDLRWGQAPFFDVLADPCYMDRLQFVKADIRHEATMKTLAKDCAGVIHLAGMVGAPTCDRYPDESQSVNVDGSEIVAQLGLPTVNASSGSVYGKVRGVCTEGSDRNPQSRYGLHKLLAETKFDGAAVIHLRFATGYGFAPRMRLDTLVNDFVAQAVRSRYLRVYQADARRTFVHVFDMARALAWAMERLLDDPQQNLALNAGSEDGNVTKGGLVKAIRGHLPDLVWELTDGADPDQRDYEVSYAAINAAGWRAKWAFSLGVRTLVRTFEAIGLEGNQLGNGGAIR